MQARTLSDDSKMRYDPLSTATDLCMPPDSDEIHLQVLEIACEQLALSPEELASITDTTDLSEHLDSVQRLTLVVGIEDHFKICFEPEDDEQATTLRDVARIVRRRMAEA